MRYRFRQFDPGSAWLTDGLRALAIGAVVIGFSTMPLTARMKQPVAEDSRQLGLAIGARDARFGRENRLGSHRERGGDRQGARSCLDHIHGFPTFRSLRRSCTWTRLARKMRRQRPLTSRSVDPPSLGHIWCHEWHFWKINAISGAYLTPIEWTSSRI